MRRSETIYLGLGSNLGDREQTLRRAISRIGVFVEIVAISQWYETAPVGFLEQPDFLNFVAAARTRDSPRSILRIAMAVECSLGRPRRDHEDGPRYGPRAIDIDLLFHGSTIIDEPDLRVPHPRLHERAFVLMPIADIDPALVHPELGRSMADLRDALPASSRDGVRPIR